LLQRLKCPHLPKCFDVVDGPRPYIVLEVLDGRSLSQRIRKLGVVDPERVEEFAHVLLEALAWLHAHGVVHRDVKAGNVFLCEDGRILLLDLGLAVDPADPLTTTLGDVMGTYAYMAPEQIAGGETDHRADLYSLGVTLYESLAGRRPYKAKGATGYLRAHRGGQAVPIAELAPPGTPRRLVELVTRLMAKDPVARPSSATVGLAVLTGRGELRQELSPPPMVGRFGAIGGIEAVLDAGGVLQLVGEPGMGVGRMARRAWSMAQARDAVVLAIRCRKAAPILDPVVHMERELERVLTSVEPGLEGLRAALEGLVAEGPVALILEDLDQAAPEAVSALTQVVRETGVAVIGTGLHAVEQLEGHVVELRSLTADETRQLVSGLLGNAPPPSILSCEIHGLTGGMPGAIVALMRDLHARGLLTHGDLLEGGQMSWKLIGHPDLRPERSLQDIFLSRLKALDRPERRLLDALAVAGEDVPLEVALHSIGLDDGAIEPFRIVKSRLAHERRDDDGDWIGLRRPALGEMLLAELPSYRRRAMHNALAESLAELPPGPWRDERLSRHRAYGAPPRAAPRALVGLGEWYESRSMHGEALAALDRAVLDEHLDPLTATHGALARGEALLGLGRQLMAVEAFVAARRLANDQGREDLVARAILGLAEARFRYGDARRCTDLASECLNLVGSYSQNPLMLRAQLLRGKGLAVQGRTNDAEKMLRSAVETASVQQSKISVATGRGLLGELHLTAGRVDMAARLLEEEAQVLSVGGAPERRVSGYLALALARLRAGLVGPSLTAVRRARRIARESRLPQLESHVGTVLAAIHLDCSDSEGATNLLRKWRVAGEPESEVQIQLEWWSLRTRMRLQQGDHPAALAACHRVAELAERTGREPVRAFHAGLEAVLTAQGDALEDAMEALAECGDRRLIARLLLAGARIGGDAEVLAAGLEEAGECGDDFFLLRALHSAGGVRAQGQAKELVERLLREIEMADLDLFRTFRLGPVVRWALSDANGPGVSRW
jgi:tetratricopeptide (TPR) repeat protein